LSVLSRKYPCVLSVKEALELMETAGILTRVKQTSGSGLPLSSGVHESIFKIIFLDRRTPKQKFFIGAEERKAALHKLIT